MEVPQQAECTTDAPDLSNSPLHAFLGIVGTLPCDLLNTTTNITKWTTGSAEGGGGGDDPPARGRFPPLDPEKRRYIFALLKAIYTARFTALFYDVVIVFTIFGLAWRYRRQRRRDQLRWTSRRARVSTPSVAKQTQSKAASASESSSSSASSTIGTSTPSALAKDPDASKSIDIEREPLLSRNSHTKERKRGTFPRRLSAWLAYQSAPIPIINKTLPSNGTSLFILAWLSLNIFFHLVGLTYKKSFFFVFADKAGAMFVVNLPLLYLLSAKNQPLRRWTGRSYEALNIFHRRVGEYMCFLAAVHFSGMVLWQFVIAEEWLKRLASPGLESPRQFFAHPVILYGIGSFVAYEVLYFSSLGSFRARWYETFLAMHVVLQALGLGFLWFHFWTARPFVLLSAVIFLVDKIAWRLGLKKEVMEADLVVLEDGKTVLLSADWDVPVDTRETGRWWVPSFLRRRSIIHGWIPTDHVFLTVPALGRSHALQAHPFTIASAAPIRAENLEGGHRPVHAWLSLLIRAQDGFTQDLLAYAENHSRVSVRLDGPYGSSQALMDMLRAQDSVILVGGGSGIAVTFPLAWALLNDTQDDHDSGDDNKEEDKRTSLAAAFCTRRQRQRVQMLWITHSRSHRNWIPQDRLDEMVQMGLELVIPEPTEEVGRPEVAGTLDDWIQGGAYPTAAQREGQRAVGVVVSGPDGLNRTVRNVCADAIAKNEDLDMRVAVEKFGW